MSTKTYSNPSADYQPPRVLRWNKLACDAIYYTKTPPTTAARALAILHTAMYDAWTAYNDNYQGDNVNPELSTTTGNRLKRPTEECTPETREKAYSYAAYRVLNDLFLGNLPPEQKTLFKEQMWEYGYDPHDQSLDVTKPQGIGNLMARLVIECYHGDGCNAHSTLFAGAYTDYTGYRPVNAPPPTPPADVTRWQPQLQPNGQPQKFLTPHFGLAKPFALTWGGQFRPVAPAAKNTKKFEAQVQEVVDISCALTDEQKLIAEYWAGMHEDRFEDGLSIADYAYWVTPPAQCCRIAHDIIKQNEFKNARAIKLLFAVSNALWDAAIAVWDAKQHYDYVRPVSAIHELYKGQTIQAWGGKCEGPQTTKGEAWQPYLLQTPPFPEYVSGHSAFSRATAEIITCFCDQYEFDPVVRNESGKVVTTQYNASVTIPVNGSKIEPDCTPQEEVTLHWATVHDAAEQAGMSRLYGGIHFRDGYCNGAELGREVALQVWRKAERYFTGDLNQKDNS
jgi:hypothetical protein